MNNSSIHIMRATVSDAVVLQGIGTQTFSETFSGENSTEDMQNYLHESFNLKRLQEELSNPDSEFYFASIENRIVAYLKINFGRSQTEIKQSHSMEIERIYVLKEFHGENVGKALLEKALDIARFRKMNFVWLGVWEKNTRAITFYKKNGFEPFDKHVFKLGNDEQTDIMMRRHLC